MRAKVRPHAQVAGAVADERLGRPAEGRHDELADRALGQRFEGLGVDDLDHVVVFVHMHARLAETLEGHARPAHLGETVDVERVDAEALLDLAAHLVAPGLGSVEADPDGQVVGPQTAVTSRFGQVERVRRRARQRRHAEVAHELELAVRVAAGDRQDDGAEALAAAVQAEAAGEQTVAVGVLQHVAGLHAAGGQRAGDEVGPQRHVAGRVADRGGVAGRARRGVHAHHALAGYGEHAERVVVAQVDLGGERE
jgi:hypothetical protein